MPGSNDYDQKINKSITKKDLNYLLSLLFDPYKKEIGDGNEKKSTSPTIDKAGAKPLGRISRIEAEEPRKVKLNTKSNIKLVSAIREKLRESAGESDRYSGPSRTSSRPGLLGRWRGQKQASEASIEQINLDAVYFSQYLLNLVNNSVGLGQSNPPFECHIDLLKEYLTKVHRITNFDEICELTPMVLKFVVLDASLTPAKNDKYDPYFKVYLPGKRTSKQAHKSRHFTNELKPKWNESFQVPVTRSVIFCGMLTAGPLTHSFLEKTSRTRKAYESSYGITIRVRSVERSANVER